MEEKNCNHGSVMAKMLALGGLAMAAYMLLGPKKEKNQKIAKDWAIKMKDCVIEKLEQAGKMSEPIYRDVVDSVATEYKKNYSDSKEDIDELAQTLKNRWRNIIHSTENGKNEIEKNINKEQ
jgi:gas vesicle protein